MKLIKGFYKQPITFHDSCNFIRNAGYFDDTRILLNHVCANFQEMSPNGVYSLCCSNGGGHVQMAEYKKNQRLPSTKAKGEQIKATGAELVVVMCHNCEDGIKDCIAHWDLGCKVELMSEFLAHAIDYAHYGGEPHEHE